MNTPTKTLVAALVLVIVGIEGAIFYAPGGAVERTGSLTGPNISSPYLQWGSGAGVEIDPTAATLITGSTTICSILSPAATSTLNSAGVKITTSSSSAMTVQLGLSSNPTATTTALSGSYLVASNGQAFIQASSTQNGTVGASLGNIVPPNTYFVVKAEGGVTGGDGATVAAGLGFAPTGACHATFEPYSTI